MSNQLEPIDITTSPEILRLAEEVERSGVGRLLKRGDRDIAVLTPVVSRETGAKRARRPATASAERDSILNIIGIGESAEPTDIAHHKHEYVAEAYDVKRPR
jgi:hypothetical protein